MPLQELQGKRLELIACPDGVWWSPRSVGVGGSGSDDVGVVGVWCGCWCWYFRDEIALSAESRRLPSNSRPLLTHPIVSSLHAAAS